MGTECYICGMMVEDLNVHLKEHESEALKIMVDEEKEDA